MSRLPELVGLCQSDIVGIANIVNTAQSRLIYAKEAGGEGWWGTWAEIAFNVSRETPYVTLPNEIARLQSVVACDTPIAIQNQFYEYLQFGNGRFPKSWHCRNDFPQVYSRNSMPSFVDLSDGEQYIAAYPTSSQDYDKKVLIQGYDANGNLIESQNDLGQTISGSILTLASPFVQTTMTLIPPLLGIQKDQTVGPVRIYKVDPTTAEQTLISVLSPSDLSPSYRRYYFSEMPCNCCQSPTDDSAVQIKAIAKLELVPVQADTDYCLIQNKEAIIEECQSVRYSSMDTAMAKQMAAERHIQAIRLLNGELNHYIGQHDVAMNQQLFGSARLERQRIGRLV